MHEANIAILLSGREKFGPHFGGAVARWTYEVYRRVPSWIKPTVFGYPTVEGDRYDIPFHSARNTGLPDSAARIPFIRRYEDAIWLAQLMPKLSKFDIVHIQNRPHWAAILRKLRYRGKIVAHLHNSHLAHYGSERLDALAPHLDCVVSCSNYIASTFTSRSRAMAERSAVVYNGVDVETFSPQPALRKSKKIFFVGRIDPQKGVLPLVQAFGTVIEHHPDAELVIGGTTGFGVHVQNQYVSEVQQESQRLQRERGAKIFFPGYIDHYRDLPRFFREASVSVFPSVFEEPFGMVICESMACGTPVVSTRRGGIPEVVGNCGVLVDDPEPEQIAKGILSLLGDGQKCEDLARRSIQWANRFQWQNAADRWSHLMASLNEGLSLGPFHTEE